MHTLLAIAFFITLFYLFIQFGRQEYIEDDFEDAIIDIEGRLEWARTRNSFPFGMRAQLEVTDELLARAKNLWRQHKWQKAYRTALRSQEAMNRAQNIYKTVVGESRRQP